MDIEPAEGYVALEFLGEVEAETEVESTSGSDSPIPTSDYNEACIAMCVGAGKKVTVCKRGDTVLVRKYARDNSIKVSDEVYICESYLIVGKIKV